MSTQIRLSIIIPTLNEESNVKQLLACLPLHRKDIEVLIVDGHSADGTLRVAKRFDVCHYECAPSRGHQLNLGASHAAGAIIWFLHADSNVDAGHVDAILETLTANESIIGGNFAITFSATDPFSLWLNQFYSKIRNQGFYYGDSGIFIRREVLNALGGVPERALMEDYALVRRMQKHNNPTVCISVSGHPRTTLPTKLFGGYVK